jgi:hypothetical protein
MRYRINTPRITLEQIDDETIVIDFDTGAYFSAGPSGSDVIRRIGRGESDDEIVAAAALRYAGDHGRIEAGIRAFVDSLLRESILAEAEPGGAPPPADTRAPPANRTPFQPPVLEKYTDMKDLLLLDPIHEVDEEGWPVQKPDA